MIQRYNIDSYWKLNCNPEMQESKDGLYVLHTDHLAAVAALEGENAKLRESQCGCLAVQFGKCRFARQTNSNISVEYGRIAAKVGGT